MDISKLTVDSIRVLSAEAIQKSKSGHPGIALGAAPIAYSLWQNALTFNPKNSKFVNRDRFILSAGHGSMLNYCLLHLYGFKVSIEDIKNFRQFGSITPGHPEYNVTDGVEISTGPLGQGIANAVGMAMAEAHLAAKYNKEGYNIVDHYTYALCGDGCMMEGIEYEAASLAGTLKLNKLIVLYDSNKITIEGNTDIAFTEDVAKRHIAQGWNVIDVKDGTDTKAVLKAINKAKKQTEKPTLIVCHTIIGHGSPEAGSANTHGAPLGDANIQALKENLGYNYPEFTIPSEVYAHTKKAGRKGARAEREWKALFNEYKAKYPELATEFMNAISGKLPEINEEELFKFEKVDASRNHGGVVLNRLNKDIPYLFGGSADLAPSCKTYLKNFADFKADCKEGKNVHFGIREHAMSAICNGIAVHGGLIPFCSTFFVLTHDSICVGEDGPTHQPIEQLISLRSMPNMKVYLPAGGIETAAAYLSAIKENGPSSIVLSRQNLAEYNFCKEGAAKGGYILADSEKATPDVLLIATGSEVELAMKAKDVLKEQNVDARVISMPCVELFEKQCKKYQESVIPAKVRARVCIEAGSSYSWYKYAGLDGKIIGIDKFGESAPAKKLFEEYGFTVENVVNAALETLKK